MASLGVPRDLLAISQAPSSSIRTSNLISAIVNSDLEVLTKVPGVGKKTAQRLVIELGEKLAKTSWLMSADSNVGIPVSDPSSFVFHAADFAGFSKEVFLVGEALKSLGYGTEEIKGALDVLARLGGEELSVLSTEDMLRMSLQSLVRQR